MGEQWMGVGQAMGEKELGGGVSGQCTGLSEPALAALWASGPWCYRDEVRETVATLSPPVFLWSIQVVQPTWGK